LGFSRFPKTKQNVVCNNIIGNKSVMTIFFLWFFQSKDSWNYIGLGKNVTWYACRFIKLNSFFDKRGLHWKFYNYTLINESTKCLAKTHYNQNQRAVSLDENVTVFNTGDVWPQHFHFLINVIQVNISSSQWIFVLYYVSYLGKS